MSGSPRHIAVVGLMGSGKTTIGRLVAARLGWPHNDSDDALLAEFGMTGRRLAELRGLEALHRTEAEHVLAALDEPGPSVVSPAASVFDRPDCVEGLNASAWVVWLDFEPAILVRRIADLDHRRSIEAGEMEKLLARRREALESVANLVISDGDLAPETMADRIRLAFGEDMRD